VEGAVESDEVRRVDAPVGRSPANPSCEDTFCEGVPEDPSHPNETRPIQANIRIRVGRSKYERSFRRYDIFVQYNMNLRFVERGT
jgi:hypothetical protein